MTRPIVWALGVTAAAGIWAVSLAEKFDRSSPVAAGSLRQDEPVALPPQGAALPNAMTLFADRQGHYSTDVVVEKARLRMLVDTGATTCAFTFEDAERAGLRVGADEFRRPVQTANGVVYAAVVRIPSIRLGSITLRGVDGMVMPRGALSTSLLGMSFLKRLSEFSMINGRLTLRG